MFTRDNCVNGTGCDCVSGKCGTDCFPLQVKIEDGGGAIFHEAGRFRHCEQRDCAKTKWKGRLSGETVAATGWRGAGRLNGHGMRDSKMGWQHPKYVFGSVWKLLIMQGLRLGGK